MLCSRVFLLAAVLSAAFVPPVCAEPPGPAARPDSGKTRVSGWVYEVKLTDGGDGRSKPLDGKPRRVKLDHLSVHLGAYGDERTVVLSPGTACTLNGEPAAFLGVLEWQAQAGDLTNRYVRLTEAAGRVTAAAFAGGLPDRDGAARRAKVALALAASRPPPAFVDGDRAAAGVRKSGAVVAYCVGPWQAPPADLPAGVLAVKVAEYHADGRPPNEPRVVVVAKPAGSAEPAVQPAKGTLAETCAAARKVSAKPAAAAKLNWDL